MKKQKRPASRPANNHSKVTEKFALYFNRDTSYVIMEPFSISPVERVPIGDYSPFKTGTKREMQRLLDRLDKKPCLIENYFKIW